MDVRRVSPRRLSGGQTWARSVALLFGASVLTGTLSLVFMVRLVWRLNDAAEQADVATVRDIGLQAIALVAALSGVTIVAVFLLGRLMRRTLTIVDDVREIVAEGTMEVDPSVAPADDRPVDVSVLLARVDQSAGSGPCCVLLVSLDDVAVVIDAFGAGAGEQLVTQAQTRLRNAMRAGDTVAQMDVATFAVLVSPPAARAAALATSERVRVAFDDLFVLDAGVVQPSLSIGVAVRERSGVRGEDLLEQAGAAQRSACDWGTDVELFDLSRHGHRLAGSVAPRR